MRRIVSAILTLSLALSFVLAQSESASAAVAGYNSAYAGESVFTNKAAGETGQFSVIFTNTGTQGWFRNIVGLIACKDDKTTCNVAPEEAAYAVNWFSATAYATVSADTSAGQNGFFIYDFKVPAGTAGGTAAVFNGDVGLATTGALFNPEGYFHINTTPAGPVVGGLAISPTAANVANGAQQQFTASNVPTGATAAWSVTGGCGAVTQAGLFVATAVNSATQPCSVVVTAGGQTASATISVYGPATSIACSVNPASVVANGTSEVIVTGTIKDANSNTVANSTVAVTFSNNTLTITATANSAPAAVAGVASKTYTSTTTTGTAQISLSSGTLTGCQATFTTTAIGAANKLAASFSPTTIAADGVSTSRLRVDVQDSTGNRRVSDVTTAVTVTRDPASASICSPASSGPSVVASGRFDFTITSTSTPGSCIYTATATGLTSATATLTTAVVGAPNKLVISSITTSPSPAGAGADNTITIVLELQDANGLRVTGTTGQSVGILSDVPSTCTGTVDSTVATGTSATGAGRSTFTYVTVTAQTCTITYSVPALSTTVATTTASVTWTPGAATNLTCVFSPFAIINDAASTSTGTVTIRDANANKVSDGAYSITFTRATGTSTTLLTTNPQTTSGGTTTYTVRSTTTTGTDTYTAAITSGSSPTLTTPTSPACSISVQTALP